MSSAKNIMIISSVVIGSLLVAIYFTYTSSRALVHEVLAGGLITDTIKNHEYLQKIESKLEQGDIEAALKIVRAFQKIEHERIEYLKGAMDSGRFKWYGENSKKIEQANVFLENTSNKPFKARP